MTRSIAACLLALLSAAPSRPLPFEERGDRFWSRRAEGFPESGKPASEPARLAVEAYARALAEQPDDLGLHFKLMAALYFQAYFVVDDARRQKATYERLVELSDRSLELVARQTGREETLARLPHEEQVKLLRQVPEAVPAHFWAAVSWGLWGMSHSRLAAGARGVAPRIRDHAQMVIDLDEEYADAGGLRLLGRLHALTPRIVFFTGWIDRRAGLALQRRALEISRRDPRNLLFLAEFLLEHEKSSRGQALELLREAAARSPDPEALVEQSETIEAARRLLAELEGEE